jgi:hypothetical protein
VISGNLLDWSLLFLSRLFPTSVDPPVCLNPFHRTATPAYRDRNFLLIIELTAFSSFPLDNTDQNELFAVEDLWRRYTLCCCMPDAPTTPDKEQRVAAELHPTIVSVRRLAKNSGSAQRPSTFHRIFWMVLVMSNPTLRSDFRHA